MHGILQTASFNQPLDVSDFIGNGGRRGADLGAVSSDDGIETFQLTGTRQKSATQWAGVGMEDMVRYSEMEREEINKERNIYER
jgi:hypothetical protein